jgi:Ala-tRNA(Pro) deacylase
MSIPQRIRDYLDSQNVPYQWLPHTQAFPAQEVAHTLHVSGKHFAKAIVLHADGRLVMAVLAASRRLSLHELKDALGVKRVEMAPEDELAKLCPDCELGAFPPFGNLYGMDVWIDRALGDSEEIVFNAGSHKDALRMKYADYVKLTKPRVSSFSELPTS